MWDHFQKTRQLAQSRRIPVLLTNIHSASIPVSTTWARRLKYGVISIEMYVKGAWYIERMYSGSALIPGALHEKGLLEVPLYYREAGFEANCATVGTGF